MFGYDMGVSPLNIFPITTRKTQKIKAGELTVRRGVSEV